MPTYEYVCRNCGHAWEAVQRISEDPLTECPSCGKPAAERQISVGGGFILKGGGWYADLYGKPAPKTGSNGAEAKPADKTGDKAAEKPGEKTEKPTEKTAEKPAEAPKKSEPPKETA